MVPEIKLVGEAPDFQSAVEDKPKVTPACFVVLLEEQPQPNALGDILIQRVRVALGIVLVVRNLADNKGVAARGDLESLRGKVKNQLFGWQPTPAHNPLERGASHLLTFKEGHVWWQDIYLTEYYDRSVL